MKLIQPFDLIAYIFTLSLQTTASLLWYMFCLPFNTARSLGRSSLRLMAPATTVTPSIEVSKPSIHTLDQPVVKSTVFGDYMPRWVSATMNGLVSAETMLFEKVTTVIRGRYVPIDGGQADMWTVSLNETAATEEKCPLVLVHGFAGGVGMWAQNLDALAKGRTVHAFDLLGFARSSRAKFANDATLAELRWVKSIEEWRKEMKIDKMVLCGHSLGGFISAAYALEYPEHVRHLIMVDPWGMPNKVDHNGESSIRLPIWVRSLARVMSVFNPLSTIRAAGPWGHSLVKRVRPDLGRRYQTDAIYDYIYQANAADCPTGEGAFKSISAQFGWARRPMSERLGNLTVPVTFIYGQKSWVDSGSGFELVTRLPDNYVNVETIKNAGHHVYADEAHAFNECLNDTCDMIDENKDCPSNYVQNPLPQCDC